MALAMRAAVSSVIIFCRLSEAQRMPVIGLRSSCEATETSSDLTANSCSCAAHRLKHYNNKNDA